MVKGLTTALKRAEKRPEMLVQDMPRKNGEPSIILDGVALAYYVLYPSRLLEEKVQRQPEFVNGGEYRTYSLRAIELITLLRQYHLNITIALPLADGTPPVVPYAVEKWLHKQKAKYSHIQHISALIEKNATPSYPDVLPPMILSEIADAAASQKVKVIYTRHNLTKFIASFASTGQADAVISQNSDFLVFKGVNYIPLNSIYLNEEKLLQVSYYSNNYVVSSLGLQNPDLLFDLSFIVGNPQTELLIQQNVLYDLFKVKASIKPEVFVATIIAWLNSPEFSGIQTTSPMAEFFISDPNMKALYQDSKEYFDVSKMPEEGDSQLRKMSEEASIPPWALGISEGGDFYSDPIMDNFSHDIKTETTTAEMRKVCYGILGRDSVIEHLSDGTTKEVKTEEGIPSLLKVRKFGKEQKMAVISSIILDNFKIKPEATFMSKDPLLSIEDPIQTAGFALRFLVSLCFTDHQTNYSRLTSQIVSNSLNSKTEKQLRDLGVIGAPPFDLFELRALAGMVLILCSNIKFTNQFYKPKLRRIKLSALYQNTVQQLLWIQQLLGTISERSKPHRFYCGNLFAALYEVTGNLADSSFLQLFTEPEKISELIPRLDAFVAGILYPFPANIFDAFSASPRSVATVVYDISRPPPSNIHAAKSAYSNLLESSDDEEAEEDGKEAEETKVEKEEPKITIALPPPPPSKKGKGKKTQQQEEDDEEAFLLAQAAMNAEKNASNDANAKANKKPQKKYVRKSNGKGQGKQVFTADSKNELKRQLKQQAMGVYE